MYILYVFERWILTFQISMRISMKIIVLDLKPATLYYSHTFRFLKEFYAYKNPFSFKETSNEAHTDFRHNEKCFT